MKTILLTAAGSAAAPAALQSLRESGYRVVACDIYPREWNAACMDADTFFQSVPASDEKAYAQQMDWAVHEYGIDFLVPLTDVEVDALCAHKPHFDALGCTLCVPDEPVTRLCRDKLHMAQRLSNVITTIPTRSPYGWSPEAGDYPMMLKPLSGRSSQGQALVRTPEEFASALQSRTDYIAQPFIEGDIYTVDVARDAVGHVQTLVRREMLRTVNGLGTTVRILPRHPLDAVCAEIAACVGIVGVVNMEFIGHGDEFYFLEVNPRFSGGVGFSVAVGIDFPALNLLCHQGASIGARRAADEMILTRRITAIVTQKL